MPKKKPKAKYHFYILRCRDGTLYSGIAKDVAKRLLLHNSGKGSAYVRSRGGGKLVYMEACKNLSFALKREIEVKKLPRSKKLILIKKKPYPLG
jgi:predicted GIY-YIG superfamily endonuclease